MTDVINEIINSTTVEGGKPRPEKFYVQIRTYLGKSVYGKSFTKYLDREDASKVYALLNQLRSYTDKYGADVAVRKNILEL